MTNLDMNKKVSVFKVTLIYNKNLKIARYSNDLLGEEKCVGQGL